MRGLQRAICLGAADGDHRLLGEGLEQFDLRGGKRARRGATQADGAYGRAGAQQRNRQYRTVPSIGAPLGEAGIDLGIRDLHRIARQNGSPAGERLRHGQWVCRREFLGPRGSHAGSSIQPQKIAIQQRQRREFRTAAGACALHYQVEYWLWIVRRCRHHLQHIDGRRLLFNPLAVFAVVLGKRRIALSPQFGVGALKFGDHVVLRRRHVSPWLCCTATCASRLAGYPSFAAYPTVTKASRSKGGRSAQTMNVKVRRTVQLEPAGCRAPALDAIRDRERIWRADPAVPSRTSRPRHQRKVCSGAGKRRARTSDGIIHNCRLDRRRYLGVAADELGTELGEQADHVVDHQDLPVAVG